MERFFGKKDVSKVSAGTNESRAEQKRPRVELNMDDIVADPGLRKPINDFPWDVRDEARRAFLQMGRCKPVGHKFPRKEGKSQTRGFVESWFGEFDWLEYSVAKDAAFCFYCYLFKPPKTNDFGNETFTKVGFKNWKKGKNAFKEHAQAIDGYHSNARKRAIDFKNQRQSIQHVWSVTTAAEEEAYKARLKIMLGIARFLLLQALAFRGHDESKTSKNKGNFMEMIQFIDEVRNDKEFCTCTDLGNLAKEMVKTDRHTHYGLVYRLIELALILPVATATVERAFSAMNIIKTERRNKMNDDWMNSSMICYIERDLFVTIEDDTILNRFQGLRNRKINLPRKDPRISDVGSSGVKS